MLRSLPVRTFRSVTLSLASARHLSWTNLVYSQHPNAPLELDPSYQSLLKDVDLSLLRHYARHAVVDARAPPPRELEVYPNSSEGSYMTAEQLDFQEEERNDKGKQKSPAALFGSQRIGAVVLPFELQQTISRLISGVFYNKLRRRTELTRYSETDKPLLHADAKRLFLDEESGEWDASYDVKYKSREQASRHGERDGTAFASVALPAHYSVIYSVLDHLKQRLGPDWRVEHVIDWGSGAGSGLWFVEQTVSQCAVN